MQKATVRVCLDINYCLFFTKPSNKEMRGQIGDISMHPNEQDADCGQNSKDSGKRPMARSCVRVMNITDSFDKVLVVFLSPFG
jgi:hypothetical protein